MEGRALLPRVFGGAEEQLEHFWLLFGVFLACDLLLFVWFTTTAARRSRSATVAARTTAMKTAPR